MRVALYFVITLFGSIGMGWWSLGWGCCVVRVELVCWRLIWFQCHYLVMGLVMLCSLVSFLWWLVRGCGVVVMVLNWNCRDCDCVLGGCGGYVLCCDLNGGVGFVWSWFVISCLIVIPLGVHLLDTCFVVKRVLWFWTIREIWVIYILCVDQSYEVIIVEWLWFLGWFAYDRDWVRCRGWGFVLVSILSAFVAYVVVDWCSGVDWLVVGGDLCFSSCWVVAFASWFFVWDRWVGYRVCCWVSGGCQFGFDYLIVGTVLVIAEFELSCWSGCVDTVGYRGHLSWWLMIHSSLVLLFLICWCGEHWFCSSCDQGDFGYVKSWFFVSEVGWSLMVVLVGSCDSVSGGVWGILSWWSP